MDFDILDNASNVIKNCSQEQDLNGYERLLHINCNYVSHFHPLTGDLYPAEKDCRDSFRWIVELDSLPLLEHPRLSMKKTEPLPGRPNVLRHLSNDFILKTNSPVPNEKGESRQKLKKNEAQKGHFLRDLPIDSVEQLSQQMTFDGEFKKPLSSVVTARNQSSHGGSGILPMTGIKTNDRIPHQKRSGNSREKVASTGGIYFASQAKNKGGELSNMNDAFSKTKSKGMQGVCSSLVRFVFCHGVADVLHETCELLKWMNRGTYVSESEITFVSRRLPVSAANHGMELQNNINNNLSMPINETNLGLAEDSSGKNPGNYIKSNATLTNKGETGNGAANLSGKETVRLSVSSSPLPAPKSNMINTHPIDTMPGYASVGFVGAYPDVNMPQDNSLEKYKNEPEQLYSFLTVIWGREHLRFKDICHFENGKIIQVDRYLVLPPFNASGMAFEAEFRSFFHSRNPISNQYTSIGLSSHLPPLDFSFALIEESVDLLKSTPKSGRFFRKKGSRLEKDRPPEENALYEVHFINENKNHHIGRKLIKARSKRGDEEAYEFFENDFMALTVGDKGDTAVEKINKASESMRSRYRAHTIRVCNTNLKNITYFIPVLAKLVVNTFLHVHFLDLSCNKLTSLPRDLHLLPLTTLYMHGNLISDWDVIQDTVVPLEFLQTVSFYGNPIASTNSAYRSELIMRLLTYDRREAPLRVVDFVPLTLEDFHLAGVWSVFQKWPAFLENLRRSATFTGKRNVLGSKSSQGTLLRHANRIGKGVLATKRDLLEIAKEKTMRGLGAVEHSVMCENRFLTTISFQNMEA